MEAIEDQTATAQGSRVVIATTPVTGIGQDDIVQVTSALVTIDTDLTVAGNLVVQGTTSLESTVVEIEDAAIILNKGGDQASANAQDSGFVVEMSDATDAGIGYDSTMASKFKIGEIGSQEEIVTVGHTQTLTNKTMTAPVLNNASIVTPTRSDIKQDTQANLETYAATATNGQLCFATDTKVAYQVVDSALVELGSGSGGGFNYIKNPTPRIDTAGWTRYATSTPSATPIDFAGTPAAYPTWVRNTVAPLNNVSDFLLEKDPNDRQGEGIYYEFDIRNGDKTVMQLLQFYKLDDSIYEDGDIAIFVVTSDDNFTTQNIIYPANQDMIGGIPTVFKQFQFNSTDTKGRLCIHIASDNVFSYNVQFNDFALAQSPVATSAVMLDGEAFTPTGSLTSNVNYQGFYSRTGNKLGMTVRIAATGTAGPAGTITVNLPNGLQMYYRLLGSLEEASH